MGAFQAEAVVVATGGLSIPKMGATGFGYSLAEQFGLRVVECRPGLVPLLFSAEDRERWCDLAGVSAEVVAEAGAKRRRGTSREDAGDASRTERPGCLAGVVILASG